MANLVYTPPHSVVPFLTSDKFANFIVGPVGSTKTTASLIKIGYEAKRIKASPDGIRRSRCAVIRNTRQMLWDTTIPDFLKWYPDGEAGILEKTNSKFLLKFDDVDAYLQLAFALQTLQMKAEAAECFRTVAALLPNGQAG